MNDLNLKKLIEELKDQNVLEDEAKNLAIFSKNLSNLYSFERSENSKIKFLEQKLLVKNRYFFSRQMFATAFLSLVLLLGVTSVVGAQGSLPGQPLYPIKIASENIASFINPSFKQEILNRRSEEIKQLSGKKDGDNFHNTINEYEKELNDNKSISPQKIREVQNNLEEAKINSLDEQKSDLERVIIKTETRKGEVKGDQDIKISPEENKELIPNSKTGVEF